MPWPIIPADVDIPPRVKLKVEASEAGGSGLRRWSGAGPGAKFLPALARRRRVAISSTRGVTNCRFIALSFEVTIGS